MVTCMACHQIHGQGQDGMAPSLVDSPWVLGSKERLTRIALHGLQGPIEIEGKTWNLIMPGHAINPAFTDERVGQVLTYIRNEWGNEASAVTEEEVAAVRAATEGRVEPWTVQQLMQIAE